MKRMTVLFTMAFSLFALTAYCQDYDNPGVYMDAISRQQENISKKFMSYTSAAAHGKRARKVENLRKKLLNEVEEARMKVGELPSFKGDKSLRDTTVNFLKFYYHILNDDYEKIINLEDIAEQSYDDMEAYLKAQEAVDQKLEEANARMKKATRTFAAANNINLVEDKSELGEMLKKVHAINDYYREVYLLFFKPYKQESYLMEALEKNNITAIEQYKSSLLKYAQESLAAYSSMKGFDGDGSVTAAGKMMMNFYIREVNNGMKDVTDFLLIKERFDKASKDFKAKRNPGKEDVDAYNKLVNEINSASERYNNSIRDLNRDRSENLNNWNKTVNQFFDEHTPKYR